MSCKVRGFNNIDSSWSFAGFPGLTGTHQAVWPGHLRTFGITASGAGDRQLELLCGKTVLW